MERAANRDAFSDGYALHAPCLDLGERHSPPRSSDRALFKETSKK